MVYGYNLVDDIVQMWEELCHIGDNINGAWMVTGDFN